MIKTKKFILLFHSLRFPIFWVFVHGICKKCIFFTNSQHGICALTELELTASDNLGSIANDQNSFIWTLACFWLRARSFEKKKHWLHLIIGQSRKVLFCFSFTLTLARKGGGGRFCRPVMFFGDIQKTNRSIFTNFSLSAQKWTAHLLKKKLKIDC